MSVYIAPKKWPTLDDNPSSAEVAVNLRRVFNTLNDHDQAINTMYANGTSSTTTTIAETTTATSSSSSSTSSGVTSFNGSTGDITFFSNLGSVDNQTGITSYTTQTTDNGALLIINDSSAVAITLNFNVSAPWYTTIYNMGTGTATLTPSSGNVNGTTSVLLYKGSFTLVFFDGANFWATLIPIATTSQFGLVMPDGTTIDISSGIISVPTATTLLLGLVKPDGTTITISGGVISATGNFTTINVTTINTTTLSASGTVQAGSFAGTGTPTITPGSTTVTGTSPSLAIYGSGASGEITFTSGTGATGSGVIATVTFPNAYPSAPKAVLVQNGTVVNSLSNAISWTTTTTTLAISVSWVLASNDYYKFNYILMA